MASTSRDPYKVLGVDRNADLAAIKTAYRKLVLRCHPDKVQDPALKAVKQDEFQRVQQAYEILSDEIKRDEYDEEAKVKKMREEVSQKLREDAFRNMARTPASPHSPKNYNETTTRATEPPLSFKPTSQPSSPFSPYRSGGLHFNHSWDRDMPIRTKPAVYEEEHRARRTSSHEKPRDEHKEERRRRKDDESYDWLREKDRERERTRDRDRDREKRSRAERERDDKKEKSKREIEKREKREKERDRLRRQDQQEKHRVGKNAYAEPNYDSEDDHYAGRKKPAASGVGAGGKTPSKKHSSSPRRDKASRRDESPRIQSTADKTSTDKMSDTIKIAAEYMTKRRGVKSGPSPSHLPEHVAYSTNFADPGTWHGPDVSRSRRPSHDEKKYRARADTLDPEVEAFMERATEFNPPPLTKSSTSPAGAIPTSSSSVPHPGLSRSATMDYNHEHYPPVVPVPPPVESSRHPSKSERRRKGSFEVYEDDLRPRRSSGQPRVLQHVYDDVPPLLRTASSGHYRSPGDVYYHQSPVETPRRTGFEKIKIAPAVSPDKVYYQTKRFSDEDIAYSSVKHSSSQYASHSYMPVRS